MHFAAEVLELLVDCTEPVVGLHKLMINHTINHYKFLTIKKFNR